MSTTKDWLIHAEVAIAFAPMHSLYAHIHAYTNTYIGTYIHTYMQTDIDSLIGRLIKIDG